MVNEHCPGLFDSAIVDNLVFNFNETLINILLIFDSHLLRWSKGDERNHFASFHVRVLSVLALKLRRPEVTSMQYDQKSKIPA